MSFALQLETLLHVGSLSPRERREAVRLQRLVRRDRNLSSSDVAWLDFVCQREAARKRALPAAWPFPPAEGPIARAKR